MSSVSICAVRVQLDSASSWDRSVTAVLCYFDATEIHF